MATVKKRGNAMKNRAKARAQERKSSAGGGTKFKNMPQGTTFFNAKKGAMRFDVIPYVISVDNHPSGVDKGDLWYQRTIDVHYGVGPEEKTYLCRKTINKRCPICEYAVKLRKSGEADDETLGNLRARERELYNVIDLDNIDEGIQLFEMSYYLFGKLLEEELTEGDDEYDGFAMPDEGSTLKVRFEEKSMGKTTFCNASRIDFVKRKKQYKDDIVDKAIDLDSILNVLSYDALEAVFMGLDEDTVQDTSSDDTDTDDDAVDDTAVDAPDNDAPDNDADDTADDDAGDEDTAAEEAAAKKAAKRKEIADKKAAKKKADAAAAKKKADADKGGDDKCPHGGAFGVDTDDLDHCETCDAWEDCIETKEANE